MAVVEAALIKGGTTALLNEAIRRISVHLTDIQQGPTEFKRKVEEARTELREMEAILKDSDNWIYEGSQSFHSIQTYIHRVQDIAHDIEDVLDKFDLEVVAAEYQTKVENAFKSAWSKCAAKRSKAAKKIAYFLQLPCPECPPLNSSPSSGSSIWSAQDLEDGDEIGADGLLDFEPYKTELLKMLKMQNSLHILVSGPGGSGKSSLVRKFYRSDSQLFTVYLWFPGKKLLSERGDEKKFLVVVDDVWKEEDLKRVQYELKKDAVGSKIVITSRNTGIASSLKPLYTIDLSRGLSWEDAEKLFCSNAFHDSPPKLDKEAQQFLDKCEGIPLAITTVANFVLSKKPKIPADWNSVYVSLGSDLCIDPKLSDIRRNLQPSYRELPSHLKDCFLYFSMFPSGEEINRGRLMRLWVAENFTEPKKGKTGEQVAEDYLDELVQRNLVVVSKDSTSARVSRCRVLELVHEINISRRYNFITVLESDYRSPCGKNGKIRRLSAQSGNFEYLKEKKMSDITGLRTFLVFGQPETSLADLKNPKTVSGKKKDLKILKLFSDPKRDLKMPKTVSDQKKDFKTVLAESKFMRVLDLQGVPNLEQFPDEVFDLILLKYLSMRGTKVKEIPKDIKKLVKLETLDLKRTQVTQLPEEVYKLKNLLTLLISSSSGKQQGAKGIAVSKGVSCLSSIEKLSLVKVETEESIQALKDLKALRKLGVVTKDGCELATILEDMDLSTLDVRSSGVHLNLAGCRFPPNLRRLHLGGALLSGSLPEQISKHKNLQKISLYGSNLTTEPLDRLQDLPLIELHLLNCYNGDTLEFEAGKFKELEILIIGGFTKLKSIVFKNGATPKLKRLIISSCYADSTKIKTEIKFQENFTAEISRDGKLHQKQKVAVKDGANSSL